MMQPRHRLLARQLKGRSLAELPPEWLGFLQAVDDAYQAFDDDRMFLERAMELSSQELVAANAELLAASEDRFIATFNQAAVGLAHVDPDGTLRLVNRRFCELFGYTEAALIGRRISELACAEDAPISEALEGRLRRREIGEFVLQKRYIRQDGSHIWVNLKVVRVDSSGRQPEYDIAVLEDVTARKQFEMELHRLARYDALSGLPNRLMLQDRVQDGLARARRARRPLAFVLLDINGFKKVNDTHGHPAGDALLAGVATRLAACFRESDTVARLGGDEFTVILDGCDRPEEFAVAAGRLLDAFTKPFSVAGRSLSVSVSAGVAVFPDHGQNFEALLANADAAMYRAKRAGGGVQFYDVADQSFD